MSGYVDLHCHLLPGVDDGARTPADALEMARALVEVGVTTVAVSPHARAGYAPVEVCVERLSAFSAESSRRWGRPRRAPSTGVPTCWSSCRTPRRFRPFPRSSSR